MNRIKILAMCLITTLGFAQKQATKTSQKIDVNKDVVVQLNTNYVEIEVDTWNKNVVEIEAYVEGEKLSEAELKEALKSWNLKVDANSNTVIISSEGGTTIGRFPTSSYDGFLKDLEFDLADIPKMPAMPVMPIMPNMNNFPELPEMPVMPELPELPKGVNSIQFDYEKYQKEGEKYLSEWSKTYEKKGGKELQKRMEEWAKKFSESGFEKKMEKWGEEFGKRFEGKWAKDMEKWGEDFGEKFGKDMEKWGERFGEKMEERSEKLKRKSQILEERSEIIKNRKEELINKREERKQEILKRRQELLGKRDYLQNSKTSNWVRGFDSEYNNNGVKRVIKIKIPKKAKLKLNVRHGELKIASLLYDVKGDVSHTFLVAEHINGSDTSINVSYSPMVINKWSLGTLNLNFVDKAQIKNATHLVLNSKSSNISIDNLTDTGIIDGSFGDLTISNLAESFKNLNLVLENSDALISLPKIGDYNLYFKGNKSKYNNQPTVQKTVRKDDNGQSSNKNIIVNAKFSNVIIN